MNDIKLYRIAMKAAALIPGLMTAFTMNAEIPLEYYSSLQGLSGAQLKTAIHELVAKDPEIKMLSYGSGTNATWWGFYVTDRLDDNSVRDRYSNVHFEFGSRGSSVSGMNIEHSFPKSWWGGSQNNAYKDLYNLMPCEAGINSSKNNYPMGVVTSAKTDNGCTKVGTGVDGINYWEPADKWKGDFARGYMYMATAYQDFTWTGTKTAFAILEQNTWPTLTKAASALYIQWALEDDVDDIEIVRNDQVQSIQHNRNPFVDFPNLMEYVWGDSINYAFDINKTRKAGTFNGNISNERKVTLFSATFLGNGGGCTIEDVVNPGFTVWTNTSTYGWKATGFSASTNYEADSKLVTPEIDLTGSLTEAWFSFSHAVNYCKTAKPGEVLEVLVRDSNGHETALEVPAWPAGTTWSFVDTGDISLTDFIGDKVRLVFHYVSSSTEASTWEVKNLLVRGKETIDTGWIDGVEIDESAAGEPIYYNIQGYPVNPQTYRGLVIRRQGNKATKLLLR